MWNNKVAIFPQIVHQLTRYSIDTPNVQPKIAIDHSFVQYTIICHNPQLEEESLSTPKPNLKGEKFD